MTGLRPSPTSSIKMNGQPISKKSSKGERTSFRLQGRCKECQKKLTWQCLTCGNSNDKMVYVCSKKNGQQCLLDQNSF